MSWPGPENSGPNTLMQTMRARADGFNLVWQAKSVAPREALQGPSNSAQTSPGHIHHRSFKASRSGVCYSEGRPKTPTSPTWTGVSILHPTMVVS